MFRSMPVSEARARLFELVEEVGRRERAVALTRRGSPVAVVLSYSEYERLADALEALSDPDFFADMRVVSAFDAV